MEEYLKQNVNRHKAEKMLDRFLIKSEKKECVELEKKLHHIEKINEVSLNRKKYRSEFNQEKEKSSNKINPPHSKTSVLKEKIKKLNEANKESSKNAEIDVDYSLEKILKHISKKEKFSKCLKLLKDLISSKIDKFIPISLIKAFYFIIYTIPFKFQERDDRNLIESLYNFVDNQSFDLFDSDEKKIWESFQIPIKFHIKLITDDSFSFNGAMKQVENAYSELSNYNELEDKLIGLFEKMMQINYPEDNHIKYEENEEDNNLVLKEINVLCTGIRRNFIFDCLKQSFQMHKFNWASVSVNNFFKKAYIEKLKFSPSQNTEIENMINIMKNNVGAIFSLDNHRQKMDEKIKNNPLESYYKVSDSRAEIAILEDGNKWENKQAGLTASKMYIN